MPVIRNKLNQPVWISLANGRSVGLLASGHATVDDADMASPHLRGFIERREIVVLAARPAVEKPAATKLEEEYAKPPAIKPEKEAETAVLTGSEKKRKNKS